jgi:uncharacterized glyoxalase superfamily protein PhnB
MSSTTRTQRLVPYLSYADAPAAIDFLCRAFGFEERFRYPMDDGRIGHAELVYRGEVLMLASVYEGFGESPLHLPSTNAFVYMYVDDIEAHHARALAAGATIVAEPAEDHGTTIYRALDPEGHRWLFAAIREDASAT